MRNPLKKTNTRHDTVYHETKRKPNLTYFMIGAAIAVYIAEMFLLFIRGYSAVEQLFRDFGFSTTALISGKWWTPFTSIFLHAGADHLILNLIALYFFGKVVEEELGKKKYMLIFIASALAGDGAIALSNLLGIMPSTVPTVGMSAAIFGLMGAAMVAKPFEIVIHPYIIPMPLLLVAAIYVLYNISSFIAVMLTGTETNVAYSAHLGGIAAGAYFGFRAAGRKKGVIVLLILMAILISVPFIWSTLMWLQVFNWVNALQQLFWQ